MSQARRASIVISFVALVLTLGTAACTDEDFENAKVHKCNVERLQRELAAHPGDVALTQQLEETVADLTSVVDGASNPSSVREKLAEYTCP
jgi:hypothetical protein